MASMLRWLDGATLSKGAKKAVWHVRPSYGSGKKSMRTNASENLKITGRMVVPG
jgi:hypothetical protein